MAWLKKDAPAELVEAIDKLEACADRAFLSLRLLGEPWNIAVWALLTGGIEMIEQEIETTGENTQILDATLNNVGMIVPAAIYWTRHGGRPASKLAKRRRTDHLSGYVTETLNAANQYLGFMTCLPMWHRDRYAAELQSSSCVRFTAPEGMRHRQVSAYQKRFRPSDGVFHEPRVKKEDLTDRIRHLFEGMLKRCVRQGPSGLKYEQPWELWRAMLPQYLERAAAAVRRPDELSLGQYTLGEFKYLYAALMTICAVHEYICFLWGRQNGAYPSDSAVMVRSRAGWSDILSNLSGVVPARCEIIIGDLTLTDNPWSALHIYPFVALDAYNYDLALAFPFPLHSNVDDNILRVCSRRKPAVFDAASLGKEDQMRELLKEKLPRFQPRGPLGLTKPIPDIDVLMVDEENSAVAILELKWIRKPFGMLERFDRDAEVLKGFGQLKAIRLFLDKNPGYLSTHRGLARPLNSYEHVHYLVAARDHWSWAEPDNGIAIVDFNAYLAIVSRSGNLHSALTELLTYEWLPVEGRDFSVRFEAHSIAGFTIESETFYPA